MAWLYVPGGVGVGGDAGPVGKGPAFPFLTNRGKAMDAKSLSRFCKAKPWVLSLLPRLRELLPPPKPPRQSRARKGAR